MHCRVVYNVHCRDYSLPVVTERAKLEEGVGIVLAWIVDPTVGLHLRMRVLNIGAEFLMEQWWLQAAILLNFVMFCYKC